MLGSKLVNIRTQFPCEITDKARIVLDRFGTLDWRWNCIECLCELRSTMPEQCNFTSVRLSVRCGEAADCLESSLVFPVLDIASSTTNCISAAGWFPNRP